jgi:hypothetical protein
LTEEEVVDRIMIDFLIVIILNLFGLILIFALADRYWGAGILGRTIPPRSVLVYENRPWWVKSIVLFTIIGGLASLFIVVSSWIFM